MSSRAAEVGRAAPAPVAERLAAYYTRYYRDTLGIPGWRELVAVRRADEPHEEQRVARLEEAIGRGLAGLTVLNVGCGTGGFNVAAARAGAVAYGVDTSAEAVSIAAARDAGRRILQAPAEALPFAAARFDLVYCYSTLEHVADARRAVAEMVRVLRPGGLLYLHTPSRWACFETHYKMVWLPGLPLPAQRAYLRVRGRPTDFVGTLRLWSVADCRRLLAAAGARVIAVLDSGADRPVGGRLWPLIRGYYRLFGVRPHVELVAVRAA